MFTSDELQQLRARIETEYAKDVEALDRLSRFLPGGPQQPSALERLQNGNSGGDPNASMLAGDNRSVLGGLEDILAASKHRTWTVLQLKDELHKRGFKLLANNPNATISVALKKLVDRGKVDIVRHGSGREPHIYQLRRVNSADYEVIEDDTQAA